MKMTLFLSIYIITAVTLSIGTFFLKGKLKKLSLSLTIVLVILPLCFILFVAVFKSSIQQGKILPGLGPLLLVIAPPQDLHDPLVNQDLVPNKNEYRFEFHHKYVGSHDVDLSFGKNKSIENAHANLEIQYAISIGGRNVFAQKSQKEWPYWGIMNNGFTFIFYNVPEVVPVGEQVSAVVIVHGDIAAFINKYGPTKLVIRKGSDL